MPAHKGVNAHIWAIWKNDKISGITWHKVDSGVDTGQILLQKEIKIKNDLTAMQLLLAQNTLAINAFKELMQNDFKQITNKQNTNNVQHKKGELPNNGILNLAWKKEKILRFLRAFDVGVFRDIPFAKIKIFNNFEEIKFYNYTDKILFLELTNNIKITIKGNKNERN